ncbi:hypothetical protein [Telluribacter sp. SYSU D00476]|uniref:hypothetical protein n=1 Tax=Telluribacter sp. SYSU D00476 TaxID=2811430 RepID=UPI001FF0EBAD|nr:hypothetical protein [Telluribacter sp. SYSU D00476]
MFKNSFSLFILLLTLGCTSPSDKQATTSTTEGTAGNSSDLYTVEAATEEEFSKASTSPSVGFSMEPGDAQKVNSTIRLKINGEWRSIEDFRDTLLNTTAPERKEYRYLGQNRELNKYLVAEMGNDTYQTYLVDKTTGALTATWSEPVPSPDGKYLASISSPATAASAPNGIQVWRVTKQGDSTTIDKYFQVDSPDWKPFELYWASPQTVLLRVVPMEMYKSLQGKPKQEDFSYVRLTIK